MWGKTPLGVLRSWEDDDTKQNQRAWPRLIWLRIGTRGVFLRTCWWTFWLHKIREIWQVEEMLLATQEGLSSTKFVLRQQLSTECWRLQITAFRIRHRSSQTSLPDHHTTQPERETWNLLPEKNTLTFKGWDYISWRDSKNGSKKRFTRHRP